MLLKHYGIVTLLVKKILLNHNKMASSDSMTFTNIISLSSIRKNIKNIPKLSGVYKHYVDKEGLKFLDGVEPKTVETASDGKVVYLLYIGKGKNLFDRFKWHLGITNTSHKSILGKWLSTLRHSYMANHKEIKCLSEQDKLSQFMEKHTYAQYLITEDFHAIEKQLIKDNDLPLNVQDNSHSFVEINKLRRAALYNKYQNKFSENTSNTKKNISRKIAEKELIKYASIAYKEGVRNKSRFTLWFRKEKGKKASQKRLNEAWHAYASTRG